MSEIKNWIIDRWSRPCGIRAVLWVAFPLMVSTVCYSVMQFIDRLFLLFHDQMEAGAIVTIGTLVWTMISLPLGMVGYVTAFVAQYRGAGQDHQVGKSVANAWYLCLLSIPFLLMPIVFIEDMFLWLGHSPELAGMESRCFTIYILAGVGMVANGVLEGLLVGIERSTPVMNANIFATILNVVIDPILIFGWWIFPEMGIDGAAWATAISMWAKFVYSLRVVLRLPEVSAFEFSQGWRFDRRFLGRFIYFGFPSGFQWFVEGIAMTYFVAVMGRLGGVYLAATSLTFSINMLAFVPIYGLGMGLTAVIGNQLGRNNPVLAKRAVGSGLFLAFCYTGVFAFMYIMMPGLLLYLHRGNAENFDQMEPVVLQFLFFVAIYCIFDAIQIIMVSVLKGAGDTWFVTATIVTSSVLFLSMGWLIETPETPVGDVAVGWWVALTCWISSLAFIYTFRVLQGKWESMRVIEDS